MFGKDWIVFLVAQEDKRTAMLGYQLTLLLRDRVEEWVANGVRIEDNVLFVEASGRASRRLVGGFDLSVAGVVRGIKGQNS
ncbi:hypothetical protein N7481_012216 [Penicillium waksmanii]|uniref:uncharacterized protein n=1 Tax=Penicillium waksmanii TaxID=69791 RepID=UPI00254678BE|nr:uncharacterized protein N7481_012216 [Penicillium waksmanii]KAJ5965502.1 hypothetical protein N7481_012216 [Penicillium waksmanii]